MSEQELRELKQKLEEMNDNLKGAKKARTDAEEEVKQAKKAQATAEKSKSEIEETLKAIQEKVSGIIGDDTPLPKSKKYGPIIFYFFIGVVILFILYFVFSKGIVLRELRDVAYARGLITFIFSLGTIGIGVILTIAALEKGQEAGAAFTRGKEIFTILVGILGTIVGFYFGSSVDIKETRAIGSPLSVAAIQISNNSPDENTQIKMTTDIRGGAPPYKITLSFEPNLIDPMIETSNTEGKFEKQLTLPEVSKDEEMMIELLISDKDGKETKAKSAPIEIKDIN